MHGSKYKSGLLGAADAEAPGLRTWTWSGDDWTPSGNHFHFLAPTLVYSVCAEVSDAGSGLTGG